VVGLDDSSLFGRPELEQGNIQDIYADNTFFVVDDAEFSKLGKPPNQRTMCFAANGGKCFTSRS